MHSKADEQDPSDLDRNAEDLGMGGNLAPEKSLNGYKNRMQRRQGNSY